MSLIDELASADINLDDVKLGDLGIDILSLGWTQTDEGNYTEIVKEDDTRDMNQEEREWLARVMDSCRRVHASALARLYVCKKGERQWKYSGMYGTATICTEADLRMACAHFIRIVDLDGFNPNSSVILQQELYPNFIYHKQCAWFHSFEMDEYVAGLSFANEEHANYFLEKVNYCIATSANDVVDEEFESKEKTFKMVGDKEWRTVGDSLSVSVARKYAAGGITDGIEVSWKKRENLPPELEAALGIKKDEEQKPDIIDLLKNPEVRRATISSGTGGPIGDGITMQWSKNKTPLTGALVEEPAGPLPKKGEKVAEKKEKKKNLLGGLLGKKPKN